MRKIITVFCVMCLALTAFALSNLRVRSYYIEGTDLTLNLASEESPVGISSLLCLTPTGNATTNTLVVSLIKTVLTTNGVPVVYTNTILTGDFLTSYTYTPESLIGIEAGDLLHISNTVAECAFVATYLTR